MKKFLPYILILIALTGICSPVVKIEAATDPNYQLLAPLPCEAGKDAGCVQDEKGNWVIKTFNPAQDNNLGAYLNLMIKIFIGICAVLSVVMIVVGGIEYMTSELAHSKEAGKEKIRDAILGLIIALGAYALLYTINPDLLKSDINIPTGTCSIPQFTTETDCAGKGVWTKY